MDRSVRNYLDRAFELAFFIHRDQEWAFHITLDAMTRLEALATAQDKRIYYRPAARRHRNRVSMTKAQLLQRLVYTTSESYECQQENEGRALDEDDMTIRYIACLLRLCLRRNAFHVAVGCGRLLYAYTADETLALYDLVAQEPDRLRDPDYFRARKKTLMGELRRRFGELLKTRRGARGELRFASRPDSAALRRLVARGLELMTPWETRCTVPADLRDETRGLEALSFSGEHPDDEHPIEMNRIHALVHPGCLVRLVRSLGLAPPDERLGIPLLSRSQDQDGDRPRGDRDRPPRFGETERRAVLAELARRQDLRRGGGTGLFRVLLGGAEAAHWDARQDRGVELAIGPETELVEVVRRQEGEDVLLAAYLLPDLEGPDIGTPHRASVRWRGGHFDFTVSSAAEGVRLAVALEGLVPEATRRLRRLRRLPLRIRRGAGVLVLVALAAVGTRVFVAPETPLVPPRLRGQGIRAVTLGEVERVFVDALGTDPRAEELRAHLVERLTETGLVVVTQRDEADAVLIGPRASDGAGDLELRLVNARGRVLWHDVYEARDVDPAGLAARIVAEIGVR